MVSQSSLGGLLGRFREKTGVMNGLISNCGCWRACTGLCSGYLVCIRCVLGLNNTPWMFIVWIFFLAQ
ncbi:hypothetical protein BDV25DRAFT_162954 [Aspergillus avenaceus]|uniref:Uncharacterized protein n=1 Tax=Aspergillus avenaceus TaxID=36643 RepID=A0A5N6TJB7_ASPAV|nr:hypothetical protein BDV25DRAFT_162954 [Aspergillus avenaceus]